MKYLTIISLLLLSSFQLPAADSCCSVAPPEKAEAWSGNSLFHIDATFTNHTEVTRSLADLKGHSTLVAMFYANCATICPRLVNEIKQIEARLPEAARKNFKVVLISFDPERDTPEALAAFAKIWEMDAERWELWSGQEKDVRTMAAALGIRYRRTPDGEIAHSAPLVLLNEKGEIETRIEAPGGEGADAFDQTLAEVWTR